MAEKEKAHKNELKKQLKKMSVKDLNNKLAELQKEKLTLEANMFRLHGSSTLTRNYPKEKQQHPMKNLQLLKRDIARVSTFLNMKLLRGEKK